MKTFLFLLLFATSALAQTPTPTPPPLKPFTLDWSDPLPAEGVQFWNVYKKVASLYVYQATVYVPAPSQWTIPLNTARNTIFAVTASDGNLESDRSTDATVPLGPNTPLNVKVTITFP